MSQSNCVDVKFSSQIKKTETHCYELQHDKRQWDNEAMNALTTVSGHTYGKNMG